MVINLVIIFNNFVIKIKVLDFIFEIEKLYKLMIDKIR